MCCTPGLRYSPFHYLALTHRFLTKAMAFMNENRGAPAPTAADLGLPDASSPPASGSMHSEGSRPGSSNSQHSLAAFSSTENGELKQGPLWVFEKRK